MSANRSAAGAFPAGRPVATSADAPRLAPGAAGRAARPSSANLFDVSTRFLKPSPATTGLRKPQAGGTTLGILIGIVIGLAIAVGTALFVTRTTLPFVGPSAKPGDKATGSAPATGTCGLGASGTAAVADNALPDPNRTAASKPRTAPGTGATPRRDIPTVTATAPQAPSGAGASTAPAAPNASATPATPGQAPIRAATPSTPAPQAAAAPSEQGATYLLQAGAFRGADDADAMKLRLALMGLEAQVVTAEISGSTLYRVRVGPYAGLDAMTRARTRLAENGVEATVLRQR